jgi:hypothetical protein
VSHEFHNLPAAENNSVMTLSQMGGKFQYTVVSTSGINIYKEVYAGFSGMNFSLLKKRSKIELH